MKSHIKKWLSAFLQQPRHNLEALQEYMTNGGDVNKLYHGTTVLCEASRAGSLQAVTQVLQAGASVDLANSKGSTPLYLAASHGHTQVLEALLAAGADPDIPTQTNYTPLASAIHNNHSKCAQMLIDAGANVNVCRPNTLGVDVSLLSYVLFAKEDLGLAVKLLRAGTLPHPFMPPLGFILLDNAATSFRIISLLMAAGFKLHDENWLQVMKRRGNLMTEKQRQLVELLERERHQVASLQRMCRVKIRTAIIQAQHRGHIHSRLDKLPIPEQVKKYLAMEYL